jgi:GNAT superfamily N-acetyltransferase
LVNRHGRAQLVADVRRHMLPAAIIRKLESPEWPTYRDLRLRALAESPDSFGNTLDAEQSLPNEAWASRLAGGVSSGLELPLIAEVGGKAAGLTWAKVDASNATLVNVYQMWVAPEFRGAGVGRMLLRTVVGWARARNASSVCLKVTCGDTPAARLYTREGFEPEGKTEPLRPGSSLDVQPMRLPLNEGAV